MSDTIQSQPGTWEVAHGRTTGGEACIVIVFTHNRPDFLDVQTRICIVGEDITAIRDAIILAADMAILADAS